MNKKFYSWVQFDRDVVKIARWAHKQNFKNIYGVPRGGMPLAVSLSHKLDLPLIWDKEKITAKTLIADDIADSGETLKRLIGKRRIKTATLYFDEKSIFLPSFYCRLKKGWIIFPWETRHSSKYDRTV